MAGLAAEVPQMAGLAAEVPQMAGLRGQGLLAWQAARAWLLGQAR